MQNRSKNEEVQAFIKSVENQHALFLQHEYIFADEKNANGIKYLMSTGIQNCVTAFIHGINKQNVKVNLAVHMSIKQTNDAVNKLLEKYEKQFDKVIKVTYVGGDFGASVIQRSDKITHALSSAIKTYLDDTFDISKIKHDHYNKFGMFSVCCAGFFPSMNYPFTAAMDVNTGDVIVTAEKDMALFLAINYRDVIEQNNRKIDQQGIDYLNDFNKQLKNQTTSSFSQMCNAANTKAYSFSEVKLDGQIPHQHQNDQSLIRKRHKQ